MEPTPREPTDLRSLLVSLWRRKWLFLAIFVSIPVAVYVVSSLIPKTYEATAVVKVQASDVNLTTLTPTASSLATESLLLTTPEVERRAAAELGGPLDASVQTEPVTTVTGATTDLFLLTAEAEGADQAAAVANAYARALDIVRTRETLRDIARSRADLEAQSQEVTDPVAESELARQLQLLRGIEASAEASTETVTAATPSSDPISPQPRRNTALAALVSLLLGLGAVAIRERLDQRLRDSTQLEPMLGVPLLSVIPEAAFPAARPAPGPVREAFRTLAASLVYFNIERPVATVIVASPTKGDGKTTVATHLAAALASDAEREVMLVDADLRYPQVALRLGIEPSTGLPDVISGQAELEDALVEVDVGGGRIQVLAGGNPPPNPAQLLGSTHMDALLVELSERADIVIIDSPPILNVSDVVPLLEKVSGSVIVAKVGSTSRDALRRTRQVMEKAGGSILGAVATGSAGVGLYGYGRGYGYYWDEGVEVQEATVNGARPGAARVPAEKGSPSSASESKAAQAAAEPTRERRRRWSRLGR
jgi:capsular exopolysaccharide synthesis family protein